MNAASYLKGHGWRGEGFSLDTTDRGLAKPLLVQRKDNAVGLGAKKHDFSNQWWLSSFDKSLKAVGTDRGPVEVLPVVSRILNQRPGLYSGFVRGETLGSTINTDESSIASGQVTPVSTAGEMVSMSTVGAGFVLGEHPSQTAAMSTRPPSVPTEAAKEKKTKRRRYEDITVAEDVAVSAPAVEESRKEKKRKLRSPKDENRNGDLIAPVLPDSGMKVEIHAPETPLEEQITKEKKEKKRKTRVDVQLEAVDGVKPKKDMKKKHKIEAVDAEEIVVRSMALPNSTTNEVHIHGTDANSVPSILASAKGADEIAAVDGDQATARKLQSKKEKQQRKERKAIAKGAAEAEAVESDGGVPIIAGSDATPQAPNGTAELSSDFIPLGAPTTKSQTLVFRHTAKSQKKGPARQIHMNPDGTIDPFAIDVNGAPGGNKLLHVPTVHPKTGVALTKKARKIIGKKLAKKELKGGREAVRERRASKKAERARQAAVKKLEKANAPKKPPRSEKYAREKAKRAEKRAQKAGLPTGAGSGANSMPVGQ